MKAVIALALCCLPMAGCGSGTGGGCVPLPVPYALNVGPASLPVTIPDHRDPAPGDQEQFTASIAPNAGPGCAEPALVLKTNATWTVSDPTHVRISSANNSTNGLATCLGATSGAVAVTGTASYQGYTLNAKSTITCN